MCITQQVAVLGMTLESRMQELRMEKKSLENPKFQLF